jgi:phosphohistidine phosphatase
MRSPTRTVLLMRHAKSSWDDPGLGDDQRPLNHRGRRDAPRVADWLVAQRLVPEQVLCSTAVRAVETLERMLERFPSPVPVCFEPKLYLAPPNQILSSIAALSDGVSPVLVVSHNPGLEQLVSAAAERWIPMPTGAVAVFEVPHSPGSAADALEAWQLQTLLEPRRLA